VNVSSPGIGFEAIDDHGSAGQGQGVEFALGRVVGADGGDVLPLVQPGTAYERFTSLRRGDQHVGAADGLLEIGGDTYRDLGQDHIQTRSEISRLVRISGTYNESPKWPLAIKGLWL
jgi:hypothetical protein